VFQTIILVSSPPLINCGCLGWASKHTIKPECPVKVCVTVP